MKDKVEDPRAEYMDKNGKTIRVSTVYALNTNISKSLKILQASQDLIEKAARSTGSRLFRVPAEEVVNPTPGSRVK